MKINKIFEIYRVKDWIHYLGYVLFGSLISRNLNFINFLLASFMLAYAFSLNDYYDKKMKKRFFLIPLILTLPFLVFLNESQFVFYFSFMSIFTLYSLPSIYFEARPVISTLSNAVGFLLVFFLPFKKIEKIVEFLNFSLLLFLLNTAAQIIHEIVHYKEDKKIGKTTTAIGIGIKNSTLFLRLVLIIIFLFSAFLFFKWKYISLSTSIFSTYFIFLTTKKIDKRFRSRFKYFGIACGIIYLLDLIKFRL